MLSQRARIRLIAIVFCLSVIHIFVIPPDVQEASNKEILKEVDSLINTQNYAEAIDLINTTLKFNKDGDPQPLIDRLNVAEKLNASAKAYSTAMKYYNEGDLQTALTYFRKVNSEDVRNFTSAREKICRLNLEIVQIRMDKKKAASETR